MLYKLKIIKALTNRHFLFLWLWLFTALIFEFPKISSLPPLSIHQGAQVDRASIALNYAKVNMNFFEPRVMETATKDGITPCEFPIINYCVAIIYSFFGPNPYWYRLLMWCLMGIGLWAIFDILCLWLANWLSALLVTFTWYFGAILAFYTPNFLPDTASLAFMLLALRHWYFHINHFTKFKILWFTLFITLACLIKITSLVFVIAMACVEVMLYLKNQKKSKITLALLFAMAMVMAWIWYCKWLENKVGGSYFLLNLVAPDSWLQLKEWFHIFYANWFTQIYSIPQWTLIALGLLAMPLIKENKFLKYFAIIALIGTVSIYVLMAGQFRYHDYYSITLLPVFLFFIVFGYKWLFQLNPWLAYGIVSCVCIWGVIEAKTNFRLRYTKGSYYYQTFFEPSDFNGVDDWLTKNKVYENDKILAAFDPNPNSLLYFLNRRGCRTFDHNQAYVNEKLKLYSKLVTDDSSRFFKHYPESRERLKLNSTFKSWMLYSLK